MKRNKFKLFLASALLLAGTAAFAQDSSEEGGDSRNVLLNAASANAGPRNVNIGLPASVGGTTVLENDLPVVYFFWPEMPYKSWRTDAMTNGVKLMDLGQTAINVGDVGFSVGTYNNLGTDEVQGTGSLTSNSFGLVKTDMNISAPIGNGWKFSLGAFLNYDPSTYSANANGVDKFFNDRTQLYKVALTKDYKFGSSSGSVSVFYKYANSESMTIREYAPFRYHADGSVTELDGFKIGTTNYIATQKILLKDANTGEYVLRDALNDYGSTSHTLDVIGKNKFDNGLNFNYIVRGHSANSGLYLPIMTGIDASTMTQNVMVLASRKTPIKSLTSLFEVGKKSGKHDWKIGLNQWLYNIDQFVTEGVYYAQNVSSDPTMLAYGDDPIFEYHNGTENKTALFLTDKWDLSDIFTLNLGARLEYQALRGDYIDNTTKNDAINYLDNVKTDISHDWLNKAFMANGIYKVTAKFGLTGEVTYNEQAGHLENYSSGNYPDLKKSRIPGAGIGVFYNHELFSLVSKATYIQRDEYRGTVNFTSPNTGLVSRPTVQYAIQTLGWTTDIVAAPFKNFNLHFLVTLQSPKYNDYTGTVEFSDGERINYNYNGKYVSEISNVLIEIDPSYQWNKLRLWASARYFSKQYANMTNSLYFKGRWETFAGANYSLSKNVDFNLTVVNLLNQRGAQGSIAGTDLMTDEQAKAVIGTEGAILSGTYIRPFTVEFGMKYKF